MIPFYRWSDKLSNLLTSHRQRVCEGTDQSHSEAALFPLHQGSDGNSSVGQDSASHVLQGWVLSNVAFCKTPFALKGEPISKPPMFPSVEPHYSDQCFPPMSCSCLGYWQLQESTGCSPSGTLNPTMGFVKTRIGPRPKNVNMEIRHVSWGSPAGGIRFGGPQYALLITPSLTLHCSLTGKWHRSF